MFPWQLRAQRFPSACSFASLFLLPSEVPGYSSHHLLFLIQSCCVSRVFQKALRAQHRSPPFVSLFASICYVLTCAHSTPRVIHTFFHKKSTKPNMFEEFDAQNHALQSKI